MCDDALTIFSHLPVESNEGLTWDRSLRCGADHEVGGKAAECDADGTYPCCSPNGWCGYTQNHCDCDGCVDYRRIPAPNGNVHDILGRRIFMYSSSNTVIKIR